MRNLKKTWTSSVARLYVTVEQQRNLVQSLDKSWLAIQVSGQDNDLMQSRFFAVDVSIKLYIKQELGQANAI